MSSLLERRLSTRREAGELAFLPFLVVGDPGPDRFLEAANVLVEAGADALELGFPYTDPSADGPVIQAADERALAAGMTTDGCFEVVRRFREQNDVPVSLLVYFNLVLQAGLERFYEKARDSGIDAVLIADLPLELAGPAFAAARAAGVAPVALASAVTTRERAVRLAEVGEGYVYAAARVGVTGARDDAPQDSLSELVTRLRGARVTLPVLAGFGLSTPQHVEAVRAAGADGAIVGSALVRAVAEADGFESGLERLGALAAELARAAHTPP
ncbi:MAG: tryptophan synthase subunit alpha [Myxococcota bacterium]